MSFNVGLTGTIPSTLGFCPMQILGFASSQLTGSLPSTVVNWHFLIAFSVRDNFFTGSLPVQLLAGPAISFFLTSDNFFTGSFSSLVITSRYLQVLRLDGNMFTGSTLLPALCARPPPLLQPLPLLDVLLARNQFTGELPSCMGSWSILEDFDVSENKLWGSMPSTLVQLTNMDTFVINSNHFTGPGEFGGC